MSRKKLKDAIEGLAQDAEASMTLNGSTVIIDSGRLEQLNDFLNRRNQVRPERIQEAHLNGSHIDAKWILNTSNGGDAMSRKSTAYAHDDLIEAFRALNLHLANLCFQPAEEEVKKVNSDGEDDGTEIVCNVRCTGFKLIEKDGGITGVVLFGHRWLPNVKCLDLKSPIQSWSDIYEYSEIDVLKELVYNANREVEYYLFDGKHAPDIQGSLFDQEEEIKGETAGEETIDFEENPA